MSCMWKISASGDGAGQAMGQQRARAKGQKRRDSTHGSREIVKSIPWKQLGCMDGWKDR